MRPVYRFFGVFAFVGICSCSAPQGDADGGDANDVSVTSDATDGSAASDAIDSFDVAAHDAQPFSCGSMTCGATQICVARQGGAIIAPQCMDIPTGCGGMPTCDCVCTVGPMYTCSTTDSQTFMCACTTCP